MRVNRSQEELRKRLFSHRRDVHFWLSFALQLKRAADLLYKTHIADKAEVASSEPPYELQIHEVDGCATFLYGLSIENLAKAVRIRLKLHSLEDGKLEKWPGKSGHEIEALLAGTGIKLNQKEVDVIKRLTAFVRWSGRYPVPKNSDEILIPQLKRSMWMPVPLEPNEIEAVDSLFAKLESKARSSLKK